MTPEGTAQWFVSGVILAAGSSTRLGRPKQLLDLFGEPLLRRVVRNAEQSNLSEVVLVLGHRASEIQGAIGELGQRTIVNPNFDLGQSTSVVAGLKAIDSKAIAVLFLLGDQPQVGPKIINLVLGAFQESGNPIVMPTYSGIPANPVLFASTLFPELRKIEGDEGARPVVKWHRNDVSHVAVSDGPPPRDVDTEEDYLALLEEMNATSPFSLGREKGCG